jgi:lipoprotein-releasing system ATP-binding protein
MKGIPVSSSVLLKTNALSKVYTGIEPVYAVKDVSITIQQGEFLSIIGPSGSGKSTLMNLLGLLDKQSSGSLQYLGTETRQWKDTQKAAFRNREIGFVFQAHLLLPEFNALENVLMPARIGKTLNSKRVAYGKELLERMGLSDRMHFRPNTLSGGQNQRVAIARALINQPKIVFADEPTGALDTKTSQAVYALLRDINLTDQVTFVVVTHEMALAQKTDRIIQLLDGALEHDTDQRTQSNS